MKKIKDSRHLRQPIISVLGHVDHGKTTLLDFIRKSNTQEKEAGGITQGIGASEVVTKEGKKITFIDTPGHAAFSEMRSRGAIASDIAILIVAANDGVKPQTTEALDYIKQAGVPYIVAITKIDLQSANAENVKTQLENLGVKFENKGGKVPVVLLSGKTGKGVDELLEVISLLAEIEEIKSNDTDSFEGVVIETNKDKRGVLVSAVIKKGMIKISDMVYVEGIEAKVKGLFNHKQLPVKQAVGGEAVQILGFKKLPPVGSKILSFSTQQGGVEKNKREIPSVEPGQIPIIINASSKGSLEAIIQSIPENIVIVSSSVGDTTDSDIFLAKSTDTHYIFTFESKTPTNVKKLAKTEGVVVKRFSIIYELIDELKELLEKSQQKVIGTAQILAVFPFNNKKVAGCKMISGTISKDDKLVIERQGVTFGEVRIDSLQKEKKSIDNVSSGEEFGAIFTPQLDFKINDMILSVR